MRTVSRWWSDNNFLFRDYNFDSVSMKQRQCRTLERSSRPRTVNIESELITIPKCSTEKMRRKFNSTQQTERCNTDTLSRKSLTTNLTRKVSPSSQPENSQPPNLSQSLSSVKNVTIHPEVTQFSYNHHKPRSVQRLSLSDV